MRAFARKRPLLAMILPAVVMLAVGLGAGQFVQSPDQVAADAAPPAPITLTAPVSVGRIQRTASADAQLEQTQIATVSPALPSGDSRPIVSALWVAVGDEVSAGDALLDVGGRPTFLMPGRVLAYRALGPGMAGPDVTQLQVGLRSLGYSVDAAETTFGVTTKAAVTKFYADRGYPSVEVGAEELVAAEAAFTAADRAVTAAETALSRARRDYDAAVRAAKAPVPGGEGGTVAVEKPTRDGVEDATSALELAREDLELARERREAARAAAGPQIPLGEVAFLVYLPATVDKLSVAVGREVGEGVVQVAAGPVSAIAEFPPPVAEGVAVDNSATLISPDGQRWEGTVSDVQLVPPAEGESEGRVEVTVAALEPIDIPRGTPIRVNVATFVAPTDELTVPEAALVTSADGETRVRVEEGEGFRDVVVTVGEAGDGLVAVTPAADGELAEGDLVVIGAAG